MQPLDLEGDNIENPAVVFEILSRSTERYDRLVKSQLYRTIDSLMDYLLVSQDQIRIEQSTRQPDGSWSERVCQDAGAEMKIDSVGVSIPLSRIYDGVSSSAHT